MERLGGPLCLLQRRALGQLRGEDERTEHVAQLLDAELVLDRLRAHTVDHDAERLQARGETSTDLLDRTKSAVGGGDREEAGLGDDHHAVAGSPGSAGERVQRGRAVDEHQVVVCFDGCQRLFELPDVAHARVRSVEVDRGGASDQHVDGSGVHFGPAAGGDRLTDDLLLRVRQDIGDVEPTCHLDVHSGGHIGLRVEVDDERSDTTGEGR